MNNPLFNNNMAPPFGKSDISNQLIRDSYQYVLQADTVTGVMYRINGDFLVNPIFTSGLTIYSGFTYVDGNQQSGYVLTSDGNGNASWAPASAATPSSGVTSITVGEGLSANSTTGAVTIVFTGSTGISGEYLPLSGGTVTGDTIFQSGLTANTISATIYENLPGSSSDNCITTLYVSNLSGCSPVTILTPINITDGANITGVTHFYDRASFTSGITVTGDVTSDSVVTGNLSADTISATTLTIVNSSNITSGSITADTYSGNTIIVNNFTAVTVSATTYLNLPESADTKVTGFSLNNNVITLSQNRTDQYSAFTISLSAYTGNTLSGNDGSNSGRWTLDNVTDPPNANYWYTTSTDLTGITSIDISVTANTSTDYSTWLELIQYYQSIGHPVFFQIQEVGNNSNIGIYFVSTILNNTSYYTISLTNYSGSGNLTNSADYTISFLLNGADGSPGTPGTEGNDGSNSSRWHFTSSYTAFATPPAGNFITDSSTLSTVTKMSISYINNDSIDFYNWLTALKNGNQPILQIVEVGTYSNVIGTYSVGVGKVVDNTTWFDVPLTFISGGGSLTDTNLYTISWVLSNSGDGANTRRFMWDGINSGVVSSGTFVNQGSDNLEFTDAYLHFSYDYDYYGNPVSTWFDIAKDWTDAHGGDKIILQLTKVSDNSKIGQYFGVAAITPNGPTDVTIKIGTYVATNYVLQVGELYAFSWVLLGADGTGGSGGDYLPLSGGTVTGGTIFQSGVTANTISQTQYIDFTTGSTNPSSVAGRVFFDTTQKALSYFDISNNQVPIAMGQQLYTRVWNASGVQIDKGKVIAITGTSNNLPSAILARNVHSEGSDRPIGLAAENIPNGFEGLVITNGILSGITLNTFANGDTLYLSDTTPGGYVASTAALPFTARTNEIGYVLQTGSSVGKIYVTINNEDSNLSLTDKERNILEGNVISGGVYEYTGMTQGAGQTINVAYVRGWVVKNTYTYATQPDVTNIYYTGGTNIPLTYLTTADSTYILVNSGSTLVQQTSFPTPQQRRENIFLGKVVHPNRSTITSINNTVDFDVSPMAALRDLWTPIKLINQGVVVSYYSAGTMNIQTSAG